jgi:adenylyltransferase/sulfurtransferase
VTIQSEPLMSRRFSGFKWLFVGRVTFRTMESTVIPMNIRRAFLALFALPALAGTAIAATGAATMAPAEAAKLVAEGKAVLVDCREPAEWQSSGVAAPAVLLPKSDFDGDRKQWKEFLARNGGKQILVYCRSGNRSGTVANALAKEGVPAANVGGLKDWTAAGLPTRPVDAPKPDAKPPVQK